MNRLNILPKILFNIALFSLTFFQACSATTPDSPAAPQTNISDMLENALGAVVTVAVYKKNEIASQQLGFRGASISDEAYKKALDLAGATGSGSGFVIEQNGNKYIITNSHVIEHASDEPESIYVFSVNRSKYEVEVVGGDSFYDIAVLSFVDVPGGTTPGDEFSVLSFKQDEPRIGEKVYAIGNPGGEYPYSVSDGIISAKNRVRGGTTGKFGFLQTTATVIWGNSGGPLLDESGKVAGINSQIAFTTAPDGQAVWLSQINFALEAKLSERLVDEILANKGRVTRAFLGLEISQRYGYYRDREGFVGLQLMDEQPVISNVIPNSPAYQQQLQQSIGSRLIKVNDTEVLNVEEVLGELEKVKPGSAVSLTLAGNGGEKTVTLTPTALEKAELELIAKNFLENIKGITMDYETPYVSFALADRSFHEYQGNRFQKPVQNTTPRRSFVILAAGIKTDERERMWQTAELRDVGAALKLSGLNGVMDFYVIDPRDPYQKIRSFREYISSDENIMQRTLWY